MSASPPDLPRRRLLTAALGFVHPAAAQAPAKTTRAAAQYQDTPRGGLSCKVCTFFRRPAACEVLDGAISPDGWCRLFDLPD